MAKYAVMVVLDLDVDVLDSTKASEVEDITKNTVQIYLEGRQRGVKIRMIRAKLLGLAEKKEGDAG